MEDKRFTSGGRKKNPRSANGNLRQKHRARLRAIAGPCAICHGRLGPIHYDEPSDSRHPLSFVIDEIKPISQYAKYGYSSKRAAAEDWNNLQAAHYCCNAAKSDKAHFSLAPGAEDRKNLKKINITDGDW